MAANLKCSHGLALQTSQCKNLVYEVANNLVDVVIAESVIAAL